MITPSRRGFLTGIGSAGLIIAAPAIVRAGSLMKVKPVDLAYEWRFTPDARTFYGHDTIIMSKDQFDLLSDFTSFPGVALDIGDVVTVAMPRQVLTIKALAKS